jgi:hypothetical protein
MHTRRTPHRRSFPCPQSTRSGLPAAYPPPPPSAWSTAPSPRPPPPSAPSPTAPAACPRRTRPRSGRRHARRDRLGGGAGRRRGRSKASSRYCMMTWDSQTGLPLWMSTGTARLVHRVGAKERRSLLSARSSSARVRVVDAL